MQPSTQKNLLLVDDDATLRETLATALTRRQFLCHTSGSIREAQEKLEELQSIDYAIVDLRLPDGNGDEFAKTILEKHPDARVVILTGFGSIASAVQALRDGVFNYLTKPVDADEVVNSLERDGGQSHGVAPAQEPTRVPTLAPTLAEVEWEHLQRVLHEHEGNISQAAKALGLHRRSLQRKLLKGKPN